VPTPPDTPPASAARAAWPNAPARAHVHPCVSGFRCSGRLSAPACGRATYQGARARGGLPGLALCGVFEPGRAARCQPGRARTMSSSGTEPRVRPSAEARGILRRVGNAPRTERAERSPSTRFVSDRAAPMYARGGWFLRRTIECVTSARIRAKCALRPWTRSRTKTTLAVSCMRCCITCTTACTCPPERAPSAPPRASPEPATLAPGR
jgi:hypothetical protein